LAWDVVAKEAEKAKPAPKTFFKPLPEVARRRGLKVGVYGTWEVGKTYFGLTFPEPIYVISTEFGVAGVAQVHFPEKDIRIFQVTVFDKSTDQPDPYASLKQVEQAIIALKDVNKGTILIDTATDIWAWLGAWVDATAVQRTRDNKPQRWAWQAANEEYRYLMMRLLAKPMHVVLTAQEKSLYTSTGEETAAVTPRWNKQTPHWVDFFLHLRKYVTENTVKYIAVIEKSRFKRALNFQIEDITFDKLVGFIKENLKIYIPGVTDEEF